MQKKYLITGIAGSGKSSVCDHLQSAGYEAYGIEDIVGMFEMYRKDTGEVYTDYDNADPEKIKNAEWRCDVDKLKTLLAHQKSSVAFYCGVASNMDDIIPLFDKTILLKVPSDDLHKRLSSREGTEDIGNTETSRQTLLGWKDWWENEMKIKGAVVVNAEDDLSKVAKRVLATVP